MLPRTALLAAALLLASTGGAAWAGLPVLHALAPISGTGPGSGIPALAAVQGGYSCPPGGAQLPGASVCARAFTGAADYLVEPDLAVSPADARVWALVANDGQSLGAAQPVLNGALNVGTQRLAVFLTSDAGMAWTRLELPGAPPPPAPFGGTGPMDVQFWDPTIAFDAAGALHVAGVLIWQGVDGSAKQKHVFHTQTDDLGATWGAYTLLGAKVDRPWMTIERPHGTGPGQSAGHAMAQAGGGNGRPGAIDLAWWETGDTTLGFARSTDGGASWTTLDPAAQPVGCYFPSPPVVHDRDVLVACPVDYRFISGPAQRVTSIYRYDAAARAFRVVGAAPPTSIAFLFGAEDGPLLLVGGSVDSARLGGDVALARSVDDGATWTGLPDLGARLTTAGSWWFLQFMGGRADPWGNVELFVRGPPLGAHPDLGAASPYVDLPLFLGSAYADEFAVAHVVIDPATGAVRGEQLLTPSVPHAPAAASPGTGSGRAGDYFGVAYAGDKALLAWEYQRNLFLAEWSPG
jgi:hypothetical protein